MNNDNWFTTWPDGLIGINAQRRVTEFSPAASKYLGWSRGEIVGKHIHEALCTRNRDLHHTKEFCQLSTHTPQKEIQSALWKHKNGEYISVDFRILDVSYGDSSKIISFIDNSGRKYNQNEMEKFSEYVELSPSPLGEFFLDGQLLFGNSALQALMLEAGFDDQGVSNAIPKNIREIGEKLCGHHDSHEIAEVHINDRIFLWHFHLLNKKTDATVVGFAFDITAQHTAEKIARDQKQQARKEFYAKMVHELRSPLNAIVGFSDLLIYELKGRLEPDEFERLNIIKQAGIQLNEHVSTTLDVAKIEAGKMQLDIGEVSAAELCREIHAQQLNLAKDKNLDFQVKVHSEQKLFSDKAKIRQIIVNLVSNAIKYTKEGQITLSTDTLQDEELGECVRICVSDTGIGIPKEHIPLLFQSFEQVQDEQTKDIQGTGLGLTLVFNLTKLLGGKISAESTHGQGSTFEFILPFTNHESLRGN